MTVTHPSDRFIADTMLGRLARWLRILGYDTEYEKVISDETLTERALKEDRWLLTRDRYLARRRVLQGHHTVIANDDLESQLRQLHRDLAIALDAPHHRGYRCANCNRPLQDVSWEEARSHVPPLVAEEQRQFMCCRQCGRFYWAGTHWTTIQRTLAQIGHDPSAVP
jgi:uncharacterized protein